MDLAVLKKVELDPDEVVKDEKAAAIEWLREWAKKRKKREEVEEVQEIEGESEPENFKVVPLDKVTLPCYNMVVEC